MFVGIMVAPGTSAGASDGRARSTGEMFVVDERAAPLGAIAHAGSKLMYRYDYGDGGEQEARDAFEAARAIPEG